MASNLKISIDVLLKGTDQLKDLAASIRQVANAGQGASRTAQSLQEIAVAARSAESALLRQAQAVGRLNKAQGDLAGSLRTLQAALTGVRGSLGGIGTGAAGATLSLTRMSGTLVGVGVAAAGIAGVAASIAAIGSAGIQANADLEQLRLGIATILGSVADVRSAQGDLLTGGDALNAALPISTTLLRQLRIAGLETALTFDQLGQGLLQALGPGLAAGLQTDEILNFVIAMSQLVVPLTGNVGQLGQEIRGLLSGNINRTTAIASALGITNEDVARAKEAGKLAEFLNERLAVAAATGKLVGQTFAAATSNLREAGTLIATEVTTGLFNTLRDKINAVLPQVFDKSKASLISDQFAGIADTLTAVFDTVGLLVGDVIDKITVGVQQISAFLAENQETVRGIIAVGEEILRQIGGIIIDLFRATGLTGGWADRLRTVEDVGKAIVIVLGVARNVLKLLVGGAISLGSTLARGVLVPIEAALRGFAGLLETITRFVPQFGDAAKFTRAIADSLRGVVASVSRTEVEAGKVFSEAIGNIGKTADESTKRIAGADRRLSEFRKKQQARNDTRFPGATVTGRKPKPEEEEKARRGTTEALRAIAEAEFALRQAFAQRAADLARLEAEQENAILDRQLEDKQISLEAYYREKALLIEASKQREIAAVNAEIAIERDRLQEISAIEVQARAAAKTAADRENVANKAQADRLRTSAKIVDLETKLNQVEAKSAAEAEENARRRTKAARELLDVLNQTPEAITRAVGGGFGQILEETLRRLDSTRSRLDAELSTSVQAVQNLVNAGLIGEIEARRQILAIEAAKRKALEENLRLTLETLRAELARPGVNGTDRAGIQAQIAQTQAQLAQLTTLGIDPLFRSIRQGLESDLSGSFFQFLTSAEQGFESLRDLALGIVDSFRRAVAKLLLDQIEKAVVKPLTDKFFDLLGIGTVDLGVTAQTVATTANTAAVTALTAAITAGSIAGAAGNGFALALPDNLGEIAGQGGGANDPAAPLQSVFDRIGNSIRDFAKKIGGFVGNIGSGLRSIGSAIVGFLSSLLGGLGGGGGAAASPDLMAGFAEGGYTGDGARLQPAGIVHAGEFVQPAHVVSRWGAGFFEAIRAGAITPANLAEVANSLGARYLRSVQARASRGYAEGGLVGAIADPQAAQGAARGVRIINVNDGSDVQNFLDSAQGEQVILNRITRSPAKFRAALGVS